jgi:streptogramin lyase
MYRGGGMRTLHQTTTQGCLNLFQPMSHENNVSGVWISGRRAALLGRVPVLALALVFGMLTGCTTQHQGSSRQRGHIALFAFAQNVEIGGLAAGPDGNIWFTEPQQSQIVRMTPSGQMSEFPVPAAAPYQIVAGSDGALWFIAASGPRLGRITLQGAVTFYSLPEDRLSGIGGLAAGADGNLWYTDGQHVGRVSPAGVATIYRFPADFPSVDGIPTPLIGGPDGNLWALDLIPGTLWRITPGGAIMHVYISLRSGACCHAIGPDHNVWVIARGDVLVVSASGETLHDFKLPSANTPVSIACGPDDALWFTEAVREGDGPEQVRIGRVTLDGILTEFAVPSYSTMNVTSPLGATAALGTPSIVAAPNGAIWFVVHNAIGRLT